MNICAVEEKTGCENYLYKDMACCLHPCSVRNCPEPICAMDFPGGIRTYLKYRKMQAVLLSGKDIHQTAEILGMSIDAAQRLFKKGNKVSQKCRQSLVSQ